MQCGECGECPASHSTRRNACNVENVGNVQRHIPPVGMRAMWRMWGMSGITFHPEGWLRNRPSDWLILSGDCAMLQQTKWEGVVQMIVRNCVYPVQNRPNFTFIWVISVYVVLGQPAVPAQHDIQPTRTPMYSAERTGTAIYCFYIGVMGLSSHTFFFIFLIGKRTASERTLVFQQRHSCEIQDTYIYLRYF